MLPATAPSISWGSRLDPKEKFPESSWVLENCTVNRCAVRAALPH